VHLAGVKEMNIENLFPIAVGRDQLGRELTPIELNCLLKLPTRPNVGNITSTNNHILELPKLAKLKKDLLRSLNEYFKATVNPVDGIEIYITQSWFNVTSNTQHHHEHSHPNSYISGVFYVSGEGEADKITFKSPTRPYLMDVTSVSWNLANSKTWWLPANTGDIVMFPSTLEHYVPTPLNSTPRMSIAFNTFLRGDLGDKDSLTSLTL
jgi:uncharacterized protein (TIGR02466 family)